MAPSTFTPSPTAHKRSEHTTKHVSYSVPLTPNRGVSHENMADVLSAAYRDYDEAAKDFTDAPPAGEAIHVAPSKDELVVYFVLEERK